MAREREMTSLGTYVSDEYQTPPEWVAMFDKVLEGIGLDPCWSEIEGQRFKPFAETIWGVTDDALSKSIVEWQAHGSIYMNCCYSNPSAWAEKLAKCEDVPWIALCNTQSSAKWWHRLAEQSTLIAFPRKRICFIDPRTGEPAKGNRYDQTIFVAVDVECEQLARDVLGPYCQLFSRVEP